MTSRPTSSPAWGIGYVPQGRGIFPLLTVEENLLLGVAGNPILNMLRGCFARFPRLQERLRQSAGTLSGGEQQMLAIARCLMMRPKLIILDEPTEGIMPKLVSQIRHEIAESQPAGISVLLVEQNLARRFGSANARLPDGERSHRSRRNRRQSSGQSEIVHRYLGVSLKAPKGIRQ